MEEYCMRDELTKKQQALFDKLDDKVLYVCVEDRQGAEFGVDRTLTIKGWVDQALQWEYLDDCIISDSSFVNELLKGGEKAIELIDNFWEITIIQQDKIEEGTL